jgi:TetR/AcrR family transcriptional repressor of nem operon
MMIIIIALYDEYPLSFQACVEVTEGLKDMKVSRQKAAENRERILNVAARLFRERGFDGIGVADLMKNAGLTHGGFYGHFFSKEDLMAQACARAIADSLDVWNRRADCATESPLSAVITGYLSTRHCDYLGSGCLLAALGPDVSRQSPPVRHTVTEGLRSFVEILARLIPGKSKAAKRQKALATYASLVGAVVLARAVDDPDLSEEILQAVSTSVSGRARRPGGSAHSVSATTLAANR